MDCTRYENLLNAVADIASEEWRFQKVFARAIFLLDANEQRKYTSRYTWFHKKVEAALENSGLRVISLEGQRFDIGMAATPLNIDDFEDDAVLYVDQMVEPIIMDGNSVMREGTVILRRVEQ